MPSTRSLLAIILISSVWCLAGFQAKSPNEIRLLFVGDILLSRQVQAEIDVTRQFPWRNLEDLFQQADWIGGNLEGGVGKASECISSKSPCFHIRRDYIKLLKQAGFSALSVENNHADDLGEKGREATIRALLQHEILPLRFSTAPAFLRFGNFTVGLVAISVVAGKEGHRTEIPSVELSQRIRLARQLSNLVIVSIHWGSELLDWPNREQRQQAQWLVEQGADIILGHHPHVVQPLEMVSGKPVYFSLGNHLFDQKYPQTKEGLIADIRISGSRVRCGSVATYTSVGSTMPKVWRQGNAGFPEFELTASKVPVVGGYTLRPSPTNPEGKGLLVIEGLREGEVVWKSRPARVVSLQGGRLEGPDRAELLLSLQVHKSTIDGENGLRPYVYELGPHGLMARWRGSALAWPLLDAAILPGHESVVCALHRGDSFIMLNPQTKSTRVAAYRWNGFGFSGLDNPETVEFCHDLLESRIFGRKAH